jgi:hypothetical protein
VNLFDDLADLRSVMGAVAASDAALTTFEGAAELAIEAVAGPLGAAVEIRDGGSSIVILPRYASAVTKVTEGREVPLELAANDWLLRSDRRSIERLRFGTNPAMRFLDPVRIEYTPLDDTLLRRAVAVALIKAELTAQPGVLGVTEGNFTIQYANGQSYSVTREDVLESVGPLWSFA